MIREVVVTDYRALNRLNSEELGYSVDTNFTKDKLEKILKQAHHLCLGYEDENQQIIGYIHVEIYDTLYAPSLYNVLALAVSSTERRRGIGAALMKEMEKIGRENGIEGVRLSSGESRKEAHLFYEKQGYQNKKMQKNFIKYFTSQLKG